MSLADLTLDQWQSLDLPAARRFAQLAADRVGGRVSLVGAAERLGAPWHRARIEKDGREFALIPGGEVTLGFDVDAWQPTPGQLADYAASMEEGFGYGSDLKAHLAELVSPRRTVTLATMLMSVEDEDLTELPADMPALLAKNGVRMPSADEWEYACGAGAATLFRWGDECSLDGTPDEDGNGPQHELSVFGLRIAYDVYRTELSSDVTAVHGGDGGEAVCGGYGNLLAWLPLATANRNPFLAEFVYGPDGEGVGEEFSTRHVITLA